MIPLFRQTQPKQSRKWFQLGESLVHSAQSKLISRHSQSNPWILVCFCVATPNPHIRAPVSFNILSHRTFLHHRSIWCAGPACKFTSVLIIIWVRTLILCRAFFMPAQNGINHIWLTAGEFPYALRDVFGSKHIHIMISYFRGPPDGIRPLGHGNPLVMFSLRPCVSRLIYSSLLG